MELKPGYKLTEVGVIPEDWAVLSLQEVCRETITYGIVQCGPHIKNGVPYIRVSDMDGAELDVDRMLRTSPSIAARFSRSTVQEGDIVYALRGKLGEVRQVRRDVAGANLTQGTARLSPTEQIANGYLLWAMRDARSIKQAEIEAKGTTFREITLANLRGIKIPIPPLPEQRAIATALSDMDELLGALDRLIAKKRDLKQAAMQQLLTGKTRLPGFGEGKDYKETEVGVIPEDWDILSLGELTSFVGSGKSKVKRGSGDYPLYGSTGVIGCSDTFEYEGDSILVARVGANAGKLGFVSGCYGVSDNTIIVKLKNESDVHFFLFQLRNKNLNSLIFGSGQPLITGTQIKNLSVTRPTTTEQNAIATILSDMDAEITALEQRRDKTRALKQAMMQELLTGKTRLVSPGEVYA